MAKDQARLIAVILRAPDDHAGKTYTAHGQAFGASHLDAFTSVDSLH